MHECERIGSLPREEILEKAWRILEEQGLEWDESVLEEKIEKYRERDRLKWEPDRTGSLNRTSTTSQQMQVLRGIEVSVEEVLRKCLLTVEVSRRYWGANSTEPRIEAWSIHQVSRSYRGCRPILDRSTRYREAVEIAIRKSWRSSTDS